MGREGGSDIPSEHPISYFTDYPFHRDDGNDFCVRCDETDKAAIHLSKKALTEVRQIGILGGFQILDVLTYFDGKSIPDWKFVLVKTRPDKYLEILHVKCVSSDWDIGPSSIMKAGTERIPNTVARGAPKGMTSGESFWIGPAGALAIETRTPLRHAAEAVLPKGKQLFGIKFLDMTSLIHPDARPVSDRTSKKAQSTPRRFMK